MQLDDERRIIEESKTNPEAFGVIFDKYYPKILAYVIRRTGNIAVSEEIVGETFTKALKGLSKFRWQGISIEAWLFRIAINEMRMHFRNDQPVISLEELYQQEGFEPQAEYDLAREALEAQEKLERRAQFKLARRLINNLPAKYQDVLVLRFVEQKKIAEIAHILNKKPGTVKSLLSRGLSRLRIEVVKKPVQPFTPKRIIKHEGKK